MTDTWIKQKERAAEHGFVFKKWLFVNDATGYAVASIDQQASGGFHVIAPAGKPWPGKTNFTRRTDAMKAANEVAAVKV